MEKITKKEYEILELIRHDKEMERIFDGWCVNFDVKGGGGRPDYFSLIHALEYRIVDILRGGETKKCPNCGNESKVLYHAGKCIYCHIDGESSNW
jgi:hypothetical protein